MYSYKSDATQMLDKYLEQNPEEVKKRLEGRLRLWDVELDPVEEEQFKRSQVARNGYAYQAE